MAYDEPWVSDILRAVMEVRNHPNGGKLELIFYPDRTPGSRRVKINPSLWGVTQKEAKIAGTDDD